MAKYLIQYTADPTRVIGVVNQELNTPITLQSLGVNPNLIIWNYNPLNGLFTLVSTGVPSLCITLISNVCDNGTSLTLQKIRSAVDPYQQWHTFGDSINSVGCSNSCMDLRGRNTGIGTPIQLYEKNGSPAQQWTLIPIDTLDVEAYLSSNG